MTNSQDRLYAMAVEYNVKVGSFLALPKASCS